MARAQRAISTTSSEAIKISDKQRKGRAVNAVAELLQRRLLVPKIFLESKGLIFSGGLPANLRTIDVLAIDRAGSGDIYIVEFKLCNADISTSGAILSRSIKTLLNTVPAHFKYLAVDSGTFNFVSQQQLFAKDGIGRIGIIEIIENPSAPPEARIAIQAERFRVEHSWIKKFDSFQRKITADIEIRG